MFRFVCQNTAIVAISFSRFMVSFLIASVYPLRYNVIYKVKVSNRFERYFHEIRSTPI